MADTKHRAASLRQQSYLLRRRMCAREIYSISLMRAWVFRKMRKCERVLCEMRTGILRSDLRNVAVVQGHEM